MSGEGIGPAVESATLAASLLLGGGRGEPGSPRAVARRYARAIDERFGTGHPGLMDRLLDLVPHSWIEETARFVCRTPYLRRRMVFEAAFGMN